MNITRQACFLRWGEVTKFWRLLLTGNAMSSFFAILVEDYKPYKKPAESYFIDINSLIINYII